MVSIAIMLGGAVLNAATFIGGSYLAKYLSGGNVQIKNVFAMIKLWRNTKKIILNMKKTDNGYWIG